MKHALILLLLACAPAFAQPQPPDLQRKENEAYLRDQGFQERRGDRYDRHRWHQYCNEWRERVRRHPRLLLPRECRA